MVDTCITVHDRMVVDKDSMVPAWTYSHAEMGEDYEENIRRAFPERNYEFLYINQLSVSDDQSPEA